MTPIDPAKARPVLRQQGGAPNIASPEPVREATSVASRPREGIAAAAGAQIAAGAVAPVDNNRVTEIRQAIEQGRYPLVPTRIADAMIAAGFLLRTPR